MRILLFGTGSPFSLSCLQALAGAGHDLLFAMTDIPLRSKLKRAVLRNGPEPERFARRNRIPVIWYNPEESHAAIAAFAPDIICIATFKHLIPQPIAAIAPLGAINLHPSLLPRQRGPQTLFRIYHDGDLETGLTVHRATAEFDAGPIILQETLPVPRGHPVELLEAELARRAGPAMLRAIGLVQGGAPERPQDDSAATRGTRFDPSTFRAPLEQWPVAQSWHFLRGFCARFKQPLIDDDGHPIVYRSVGDYLHMHDPLPPGRVEPAEGGWRLHCNGGVIRLMS
jgi:methionyl-tRNA formyltransferase